MIKVFIRACGDTYGEQHRAAYEMLFDAVKKLYGVNASFDDILISERGKPYFKDIPVSFNISHCKGFAVSAVTESENGEVGVDCENIRICRKNTAARVFSPKERQLIMNSPDINLVYTELWTLKEAYVKYTGTGLAGHMRDISFSYKNGKIVSSDSEVGLFTRINDDLNVVSLCCRSDQTAEFAEMGKNVCGK